MSSGQKVRFGHSESEQLLLTNFKRDSEFYSLDAEISSGAFSGAAKVFGHTFELEQLHQSLSALSGNLSGKVDFENLEGQLKVRCEVGSTGIVHFDITVTDHSNRMTCSFDTDPASLEATIASLKHVISDAHKSP